MAATIDTTINSETIHNASVVYVHITDERSKAKPGATRVVSARRNGVTKTWKTRPGQFRAPFKYGLRECFYITQDNAHRFFLTEDAAAQSPAGRYIDC